MADKKPKEYNHLKIEKNWQKKWQASGLYKVKDSSKKPKCYVLDMFPYPSGEGLHVGHPKGYIATDIYARFKTMSGFNVLHPMGFDAFGLPAENYAIQNKVHPKVAVTKNIKHYKEQLSAFGFNYDWSREIDTTDPEYYKWTQWIFLQMFKKGLAFESHEPINWCPSCKTGLANEDLEDGKCERCGSVVELKPLRQWVLKITDYADRLLKDLDSLDWPTSIKESQRNWIGKSEGAEIDFPLLNIKNQPDGKHKVKVFTTRPDTLFGVTFLAISPELAHQWMDIGWEAEVETKKYVDKILKDRTRQTFKDNPEKTGVFTGLYAENPANKEKIPVWVTNYVLGSVGTGAIMAVPAHDERDFEFAKKYDLPIINVIESSTFRTEGEDAVQKDKNFVERDAVIVIIKHWEKDEFLCSKYKKNNWQGFVFGGIEKDESLEKTAIREVLEETGYSDAKFLKEIGTLHSTFFHIVKNENRVGHFRVVYVELKNGNKVEISQEEKDLHDTIWIPRKEVLEFLNRDDLKIAWKTFNDPNFCYLGKGILSNSGKFSGLDSEKAKKEITKFVGGKMTSTYKLRDWVFSRQRYWGEPIPLIHCGECGVVPVPEKDLPVKLPDVKSYEPTGTGESPLAGIDKWVNVRCPKCKNWGKRETNTMPQWAGSSWYYLRYMDVNNKKALVDPKKEKYWAPVDMYVGGSEHATRHLIYARFWHKFLYDLKVVSTSEPFARIGKNLGLILGADGRKMSKRWGNVINPDDVIKLYGADTLRVYEMFMGPFEQEISWNTDSMIGSRRFVEKVWRLAGKVSTKVKLDEKVEVLLNQTIKKVGEDIESFDFNTAISALMILVNELDKADNIPNTTYQVLLSLMAPFAPHMVEELWSNMGNKKSIHMSDWPVYNSKKLQSDLVKITIQVNGKVRDVLEISLNTTEKEILVMLEKRENVQKWLVGVNPKKTIFVPNKLINIVI